MRTGGARSPRVFEARGAASARHDMSVQAELRVSRCDFDSRNAETIGDGRVLTRCDAPARTSTPSQRASRGRCPAAHRQEARSSVPGAPSSDPPRRLDPYRRCRSHVEHGTCVLSTSSPAVRGSRDTGVRGSRVTAAQAPVVRQDGHRVILAARLRGISSGAPSMALAERFRPVPRSSASSA